MSQRPIRIVLAKLGLDDHLRPLLVLSHAFRDAGMEVIYLGPYQTPESVVAAAEMEGADAIGLSFHTVSYFGWAEETVKLCAKRLGEGVCVFVGGTIPREDRAMLESIGVRGVFFPGDPLREITDTIARVVGDTRERAQAASG